MELKKIAITAKDKECSVLKDVCSLLDSLHIEVIKPEYEPACGAYAIRAAEIVSSGEADGAIVIGSNGLDSAILGNKFASVRASLVSTPTTARYTREHNASNLLCIGADLIGPQKLLDIVKCWVMIKEGELHQFGHGESAAAVQTNRPIKHIYIGNDHAGYEAKLQVLRILEAHNISYTDLGTDSTDIVRYPYYAARIAHAVLDGDADAGIAICGTGIGISIAVNKFKGIRAALCNDRTMAKLAKEQFDANVLCIGGKIVGAFELEDIVNEWLADSPRTPDEILDTISAVENANMTYTSWRPANNV